MSDVDLTTVLLDWSSNFMRLSMHDFNRFTRRAGLSLAQMNILMHLHYRGSIEVTNLCAMMQISPAGASQMIGRMVDEGVVERVERPGDRRVRLVQLTDQGRQIVMRSIEARQAWISELVSSLPPEERATIASALQTLNERAAALQINPV